MTSVEVVTVDSGPVTSEALAWPDRARETNVTDANSYTAAAELLKGIKALRGRVADTFDSHISRAFQAHRALCAEKQKAEAPLTEAEGILKRALVVYNDTQERRRREEEAHLREQARQEEEARRIEEAAALELQATRENDPALLEEAHAIMDEPAQTPTVIVQKSTPKISGISFRENWKWRLNDSAKVPREYLKLDDVKIGGVVRALKGSTKIPGIEVYADKGVGAGSR